MKSQKSMVYVLTVMLFGFVAWSVYSRKKPSVPVEPPEIQSPGLAILPEKEGGAAKQQEERKFHEKAVAQQREQYKTRVMLGTMRAMPKVSKGQYIFKLGYEPVNLGCSQGDVDIIQEALPDKRPVLLTLDADEDGKPVLTRKLTLEELRKPFEAQIKILASSSKVYRLTLCSDMKEVGDCRQATPASMDFQARKKHPNKGQSRIFYAQTFIASADGLQIFDSRRQDLQQKNIDVARVLGAKKDSTYLKQLAAINASVKPLPATFQNNTFKMKLTFRDMDACRKLGAPK